jgi:acetyl-CoA acetyltransferase
VSRSDANGLRDRTAIVGIGATEFSKNSGRSELRLAVEAVKAALADAGIPAGDVDGIVCFTGETNPEIQIARNLGMGELRFFSRIHHGGGAGGGCIQQAAMAVATGVADVVVCYRAFNERSGNRFGQGVQNRPPVSTAEASHLSWYAPFGLLTPAQWVAMFARRIMHEFGATSEDFGRVAVADRLHAANNPAAYFYGKPITLEDHQNSRWIVEPLHLLDCCQESDGGQAIVVTSAERARDLRQVPAVIRAAAQGSGDQQQMMTSYYRESITGLPEMGLVARQLYATAGIGPEDIQTAVIYDHFMPLVLPQLEEFGFCPRGEAKDFLRDGNITIGGRLPVNTNGGQLGEAYIHGMNGIAEAVRQVRNTSTNPVPDVEHVLVTAGTGVPTSGIILGRDRGREGPTSR